MKQAGIAGRILLGMVIFFIWISGVSAQTWTPTGNMTAKRVGPTATLLTDGKVLVVGGSADATHFGTVQSRDTAEIYNPSMGAFSLTLGNMSTGRVNHTVTRLPNGKVLIAGGTTASANVSSLASAELYDPVSNTFTLLQQQMVVARSGHVAALLPNGTVLLAGGVDTPTNGTSIASAEIYDPSTQMFTLIGSMTAARRYITTSGEAIARSDGSVLIAGGVGAGQAILSSADLFGQTGFTATSSMSAARFLHATALLQSGEVLVAGGVSTGGVLNSADLFTSGGSFTPTTGLMTTPRLAHTATGLPDGHILIVGGNNENGFLASAELYNATTKSFTATGSMATARRSHIAVLLPTGKVLAAGGEDSQNGFASAELYSPSTEELALLNPASLWIGLKNSDDQGTQFDLRAEVYINDEVNDTLVAVGQTLCITNVTRNPDQAKNVTVPFGSISDGAFESGDTLSLKILTRIGTNPNGTKCSGPGGSHNNAVGLRLYYDAVSRPSQFEAELTPDPLKKFFLHSNTNNVDFFDETAPTAPTAKFKDSAAVNFAGGNLWKITGTWSMTLP